MEEDSDGTPSESEAESLLCNTKDTESDDSQNPFLCLCIEVFGESGHHQTATFVIMKSGGSVAREETYLLDQSV